MAIYRKKHHLEPLRIRIRKGAETAIKCFLLFLQPTLFASLVSVAWYFFLYRHDRNFGPEMQDIIATAVLPAIGILYGILLTSIAVFTVWGEYKAMRTAVKRYDLDTFMDLRDEELSALIRYGLIAPISFAFLSGFLVLKYSSPKTGGTIVFSVAFFLTLMYVVVRAIDDPCSGLWHIKGIPDEWLEIDPKAYRAQRNKDAQEAFSQKKLVAAKEKT